MGGAAVLVAAGTAGCGSGGGSHSGGSRPAAGGPASAVRVVQAAYTASTSQKTATFRLEETISATSSAGSAENVTITGSGQADFAARAFRVSMNSPSGGAVTVLQAGGTEYVQVPAAQRNQVPGRKPWVSVNLNKVSQARLGASFSQLSSVSSDNPARALSELAAVSGNVTRTGTATIGGVTTTAYRARENLRKVAARVQAKAGAKAAEAIRQEARALGTAALPVQVWVDAQHLVRQIRYQVPLPATGSGSSTGKGTASVTITLSGYGATVRLSPPPASQTADITSQLLQQARASTG